MSASNGHSPNLVQLKEQVEAARLKQELKLLESFGLWDDDFGGAERWYSLRGREQGDGSRWLPLSTPSDRRHGANWPLWRNLQDLDELRQRSRVACQSNGYAKGLLANMVNYLVGDGCGYKVTPKKPVKDVDPKKPGTQQDPALLQLAARAQQFLDAFLTRNHWTATTSPGGPSVLTGSREREIVRRVFRDGECFIRLYGHENGAVSARWIEPEQLRQPPGGIEQEGWSYGIRHAVEVLSDPETGHAEVIEDIEDVREYFAVYLDPSTAGQASNDADLAGTCIPADQVVHLKGPDTDSSIKRGTPAFSWDTLEAFERASKLSRNLSMSAAIRAATAEIWQSPTGTREQVQSLADYLKSRDYQDPETGKTERVERIRPGTIRRMTGLELASMPEDQSSSYVAALQADLRQAASSFGAPEYMISADASNSNFASTKEAGSPWSQAAKSLQGYFKSGFLRVAWWALDWAVRCGKLPEEVLTLLEVQVEAPAVVYRDESERASTDKTLAEMKVKSPKTSAMERGLDPEVEAANFEEWDARFKEEAPPGMPPGGPPGGPPGAPGGEEGPPGKGSPPANPLAALGLAEGKDADAPADDDPGTVEERADLIADILLGVYGDDDALALFQDVEQEGPVKEALDAHTHEPILVRLFEAWDAIAHPRSKETGRFISKNSPEALSAAHEEVKKARAEKHTPEGLQKLTEHLSILTVAQLHELKRAHGLKAGGRNKAELVKKIAERLPQTKAEEKAAKAEAPAPAPAPEVKPEAPAAQPVLPTTPGADARKAALRSAVGPTFDPYNLQHADLGNIVGKHDTLEGALAAATKAGLIAPPPRDPTAEATPSEPDRQGAWVRNVLGKVYGQKEEAPATGAKGPEKQPWEMTREEYVRSGRSDTGMGKGNYRAEIENAIEEGKPVPRDIAKEYPDVLKEHAPHLLTQKEYQLQRAGDQVPGKDYAYDMRHAGHMKELAGEHGGKVKAALAAGKPVPPEVLADYPDLAAQAPGAPAAAPPVTPTPAGGLQGAPLADAVREAGRKLTSWTGASHDPAEAGWNSHKVYVSELYDALKPKLGGASLEDFKKNLLQAHQAGHLELHRNDLVQASKEHGLIDKSEIGHMGAEFHVVDVNRGPRGAAAKAAPTPAAAPPVAPAPAPRAVPKAKAPAVKSVAAALADHGAAGKSLATSLDARIDALRPEKGSKVMRDDPVRHRDEAKAEVADAFARVKNLDDAKALVKGFGLVPLGSIAANQKLLADHVGARIDSFARTHLLERPGGPPQFGKPGEANIFAPKPKAPAPRAVPKVSKPAPAPKAKAAPPAPAPKAAKPVPAPKPAAAPKAKAPGDHMSGHPLAGKTPDEAKQLFVQIAAHTATTNDPWGLAKGIKDWSPASADPAQLESDIVAHVRGEKARSSFAMPSIPEAFDAMKAKHPGLTLYDFQRQLAKMQLERKVRMSPYTRNKASIPRPLEAIPLDREVKYYVDLK